MKVSFLLCWFFKQSKRVLFLSFFLNFIWKNRGLNLMKWLINKAFLTPSVEQLLEHQADSWTSKTMAKLFISRIITVRSGPWSHLLDYRCSNQTLFTASGLSPFNPDSEFNANILYVLELNFSVFNIYPSRQRRWRRHLLRITNCPSLPPCHQEGRSDYQPNFHLQHGGGPCSGTSSERFRQPWRRISEALSFSYLVITGSCLPHGGGEKCSILVLCCGLRI